MYYSVYDLDVQAYAFIQNLQLKLLLLGTIATLVSSRRLILYYT